MISIRIAMPIKRHPWISGFDKFRDFATYELLYVGIATAMGTFNRLFKKAHHARQSILCLGVQSFDLADHPVTFEMQRRLARHAPLL